MGIDWDSDMYPILAPTLDRSPSLASYLSLLGTLLSEDEVQKRVQKGGNQESCTWCSRMRLVGNECRRADVGKILQSAVV